MSSPSGNPTTPELPVRVGDLVTGKYRVDRVLGRGGMGVVVAATHAHLDQRVALKFLLPEVASHTEIVQRFLREARASVRIQSEHVARVLDVGTLDDGTPFMVMEFLEGEDLAQTLSARGPLPSAESVGFVLEACEAVAEAHALGMVHRDLKPANLFLARRATGKPVVKVLDFGISKVPTTERDHAITRTSAVMGSPGYMSPEQMMSADRVDVRSDIWSLGVVLYELLGQRLPFPANTMPELIAAILQKAPEPLSSARPDLPVGLTAVIERCLQKDREARYASVAELARALAPFGPPRSEQSVERIEAVLGVERASVQPPSVAADAKPAAPSHAPMASARFEPRTSQTSTGPRRLVVPGAIALALVAALAGLLVLRGRAPATASIERSTATAPLPAQPAAPPTPSTPSTPVSLATSPTSLTPPVASSTALADPPSVLPGPSGKPHLAGSTRPSASTPPSPASASAAAAASTPSCHLVSYFDADGNKHFRQECP